MSPTSIVPFHVTFCGEDMDSLFEEQTLSTQLISADCLCNLIHCRLLLM